MQLTTVREIYKNPGNIPGQRDYCRGYGYEAYVTPKHLVLSFCMTEHFLETLQVVYHDSMENFAEISRLNVGAAIIVKGTLVATPQAKQPFEIQATEISVEGASAPDYPLQKKPPQHGISAYGFTPASENQYVSGSIPCAFSDCLCHSQVLPGERICLCAYTTDHRK